MKKNSLFLFASILAGKYSNYSQAQKKPKDFAHINIYFRPLRWSSLNGAWFYSEQSYDYAPWSPYRQAMLKLSKANNLFILDNYSLKIPERVAGAGFNPELLATVKGDLLSKRFGCAMHFTEVGPGEYIGKVEPGCKCLIKQGREITYLKSHVKLNANEFISLDEGIQIITNKKIWGSENGPLKFKKVEDLNSSLIEEWMNLN